MHREVRIQTEDFVPDAEYQALRRRSAGSAGAIATFVGLVRGVSGDADAGGLQALHLEHYPGMTERSIEAIVDRAAERWPLLDVVVVHRVGALAPAAQIVYVQVASAHRAAAFAACEFIMDYLKTRAPFWKKEQTGAGARWVDARATDDIAAERWRLKG